MDLVTVTVLRSSDGGKISIKLPLSSALNTFKDKISASNLGPLKREHQRLFHLGRELKSGRRSLSALGVGKFQNFLVHLHSTAPATIDLAEDDDVICVKEKNKATSAINESTSSSSTVPLRNRKHTRASNNNNSSTRQEAVIDLLDDDDDEDDGVVVVSNTSAKRRRRG